jgi:hypothetical protein
MGRRSADHKQCAPAAHVDGCSKLQNIAAAVVDINEHRHDQRQSLPLSALFRFARCPHAPPSNWLASVAAAKLLAAFGMLVTLITVLAGSLCHNRVGLAINAAKIPQSLLRENP